MLLTFAGLEVQAQTKVFDMLDMAKMKTYESHVFENICIFEPTNEDAFYYKRADQNLLRKSSNMKSATFDVDYISDGSSWPQQAREAFEYALSIWETHISSEITIRVSANWVGLPGSTLGSAGPTTLFQIQEGEPNTWYSIAQASAILGTDLKQEPNGPQYDIIVNMNSDYGSWYYGTDANTPSGQTDFVTVVLHEIGHGLGFFGGFSVDEENQTAALAYQGDPVIYDVFNTDGFGEYLTDQNAYSDSSSELYNALTGMNEDLFATGEEGMAAFQNLSVPIYSPAEWNPGSSYSHLDLATFSNTENALMRPSIENAFAMHSPGPVMCGMFADKGWPLAGGCLALLGAQSQVAVNQTEYEFGVTNAGTKLEETFTISNIDTENPLVGRIEVASGGYAFSLDEEVVFMDIEPGAELETPISYYPLYAREASGEIRISHNGSNLPSPIIISLEGEALEEDKVVELNQNYPNPFNATTNIPYTIPQDSYVRLEIYDILGQKIQTLVDENQQRGKYVARLNANEFSSGVYLYRILVQGTAETGKLMLVK